MTNPVTAAILTIGCCLGMCLGGAINAYDKATLEEVLNDPSFYHLVDQAGNPVSKELH